MNQNLVINTLKAIWNVYNIHKRKGCDSHTFSTKLTNEYNRLLTDEIMMLPGHVYNAKRYARGVLERDRMLMPGYKHRMGRMSLSYEAVQAFDATWARTALIDLDTVTMSYKMNRFPP